MCDKFTYSQFSNVLALKPKKIKVDKNCIKFFARGCQHLHFATRRQTSWRLTLQAFLK